MVRLPKILSYSRWLSALIIAMTLVTLLIGGLALHSVEMNLVASAGESRALVAVEIADKLNMLMAVLDGTIQRMAYSKTFQGRDAATKTRYQEWMVAALPVYGWLGVTVAGGRIVSATDHASVGQVRSDRK
jgi:hypothetical protein